VNDGQTIQLFTEAGKPFLGEELARHDIFVPPQDTFLLEARHFMDCVANSTEPLTNGSAQRRALEFVLAAYASMASGQPVQLT
jgi:predicted dehydrogenase